MSTSERFARLHQTVPRLAEFCQSLYMLLVAHADDYGRQAGDEFTVKHAVVPTSPRKLQDITRALAALHEVGLITWYEVEGRKLLQVNNFDPHQSGLHKRTVSKFPEPSGKFPEIPLEQKGTEQKGIEPKGREGASRDAAPTDDVEAFRALWNETTTAPLPRCQEISDARRRRVQARLLERPLPEWTRIFARINASAFCRGENDRGWVADFDWVLQPDTAVKVLEGKYDDRAPRPVADRPFTAAERQHAERARKSAGRCFHDPPCASYAACVEAIMRNSRQKVPA